VLNKHNFRFEVDLNVINHLGVGLYSSTPAALTELVANAWDADAENVWIEIKSDSDFISIEDDGHGMSAEAVKEKFLHVGYSRRIASKSNNSASGTRKVMGRKGIGKLSMFALSNYVKVTSQESGGELIAFEVDVPDLKRNLEERRPIVLNEFSAVPLKRASGTRIELTSVLKTLNRTEGYLRTKLARRFSVLGQKHNFRVHLNGTEITETDRDIYDKVQFVWGFDDPTLDHVASLAPNLAKVGNPLEPCRKLLSPTVSLGESQTAKVTGFMASVFKPSNLGAKEDSANAISIFANGRVFAENILGGLNSAKYYQNYLVGEIHADFLDDDEVDRATASREAIKKDDPKYRALVGFALSTLESIGDTWDEWRLMLGLDVDIPGNAAVTEWLETLKDSRDQKVARRLMTSVQNATVHSDEKKNAEAKVILYRGAIIGFEKLRIKNQLDRLGSISDVLSAEFAAIFSSLSDIEEAAYADITRQRLEVIKKFRSIKEDAEALERVAQTYLFDHLWLLDPSWDRVTGRAQMEVTMTEHIKKVDPDSSGARLDISYRASSGRHIVVELKRPRLTNLKYTDLYDQARKYRQAVTQYYKEKLPNKAVPPLDIYILISRLPSGFDENDRQSMAGQNAKIITYDELISDATNAYQEYLDVSAGAGGLESILKKL
jgi:hypothetical protein